MDILEALARKLAEDNGLELTMASCGHGCVLSGSGMKIRMVLQPGSNILVAQTAVGLLPDEGRDAFMTKLLAANDFLSGTNGMTLGLNVDAGVATLQAAWDAGALSQERFGNLVANLLVETERWIGLLSEPSEDVEMAPTVNGEGWVRI